MQRVTSLGSRAALALSASVFVACPARTACADAKMQCVESYEAAQKLRQEGKLRASRAELLKCSSEACPPSLRKDCAPWLREVEDALPTVVLAARAADGHDLVDVRVTFDGAPLVDQLDGRAVAVDPGVHVFRFETSGLAPVDERVVVREGQKLRALQATFTPAPTAMRAAPLAQTPPAEPAPGAPRPVPIAAYVLGGVGVVALGAAAYFFFTRPTSAPTSGAAATRIEVGAVPGGAVAAMRGSF